MKTVSVKVMRSYDYCHFEVALSTDDITDIAEVNTLRCEAARLVDRAVEDYKEMKKWEMKRANTQYEREKLGKEVQAIKENFPKSEWTEGQKAKVKALKDMNFKAYCYDDPY